MQHESMALHDTWLDKKMCYPTSDRTIIKKDVTKPTELPALNHNQELF
jgi:hypothetical protein